MPSFQSKTEANQWWKSQSKKVVGLGFFSLSEVNTRSLGKYGSNIHLGTYDTPEEAALIYAGASYVRDRLLLQNKTSQDGRPAVLPASQAARSRASAKESSTVAAVRPEGVVPASQASTSRASVRESNPVAAALPEAVVPVAGPPASQASTSGASARKSSTVAAVLKDAPQSQVVGGILNRVASLEEAVIGAAQSGSLLARVAELEKLVGSSPNAERGTLLDRAAELEKLVGIA